MARLVASLSVGAILLLLTLGSFQAAAQTADPTGGAGVKAYGAYHGSSIEHISLETSKLIANIPLISYPQRGGKLRVEFALHWYNPVYTYTQTCSPYLNPRCLDTFESAQPPALFQALEGLPYISGVEVNNNPESWNNTIWDSDGGGHQTAPVDSAGQGPVYRSIDATGYWLYVKEGTSPNTIIDANGIQYTYPSSGSVTAEDSNGNEMTIGTSVVDTLGRTIPFPLSASNPTTTNFTGCTGPLPTTSASLWTPPDQNGGTVTFKFCYAGVHIQINALPSPCPADTQCVEPNGTFTELQSIVLPNGTAWEFEYKGGTNSSDSTVNAGLLSKMTLPTGGTISYTWNTPPEYQNEPQYIPAVTSRTVNANDGSGAKTWSYAGGTITDPLGNNEVHTLTALASCGAPGTKYDTQVQYYQGSVAPANLLKTVSTTYNYAANPYDVSPSCGVVNVVPLTMTTAWPNGQISKETKSYDSGFANYPEGYLEYDLYGKVVSDTYYDYGASAPGPVLKQVNNAWLALTNANYLNGNLLNLLSSQQIVNASGAQQAYTSNTYDSQSLLSSGVTTQFTTAPNGAYRGNLTAVSRWLNTTNTNLTTTNTYYDAGMLGKTQDPVGNITQYFYSTTHAGGYLTSLQDALNHTTTFTYDYNTGEMLTKVDPNKQLTSYSYDNMRRVVQVKYPDGGQTSYLYTETSIPFTVTTTEAITSSLNKTTIESVDGFGRETESQLTSDPQGTVYVYTAYDGDGREYSVTNPYRTTSDTTYGIAYHLYDGLGRIATVTQPDGSKLLTSYAGSCTTVTDEIGNKRTSCVDGLGRLTGVWEDPNGLNYETDYAYDPLSDLLSVNQKGGSTSSSNWRTRTFTYDSLSRIVCAANPEVQMVTCPSSATGAFPGGAIRYVYDSDGNVLTKTAPSPNQPSTGTATVTTTYTYDALNRLTGKSYADTYTSNPSTAGVLYGYDGVAPTGCVNQPPADTDNYPINRRTAMCDGSGATSWAHDQMGRVLSTLQTLASLPAHSAVDVYNLDGSIASLTNLGSSGVVYTYSGAGRPLTATNAGGSTTFVTGAAYAPPGELTSMTMGMTASFAGIQTSNAYDNRLQPILLSAASPSGTVFSLCFDYHLGVAVNTAPCSFPASPLGDNGNVYQIVNNRDSTRTETVTYDSLNRIASGYSSGTQWGEAFTIDAWGNLTNKAGIAGKTYTEDLDTSANTNNQLSGYGYDAAGNFASSGYVSYIYDAENRLIATGGYSYFYDGDGRRVEKCTEGNTPGTCGKGATGTLYWRGIDSDARAETNLAGGVQNTYIFFNGQRIARLDSSGAVHYYFSDHLGTHAVVENATGTACEQDIDYYPYGGEQNEYCTRPVFQNYKLTGKERDLESGLDNFGARYESSGLGRFMTPDWAARPISVPYAKFGDPQTLNLYSYVENGPLNRIDADGHWQQQSGDSEAACFNGAASCTVSPNQHGAAQNQGTNWNTVGKGTGEVGLGAGTIGLAIVLAPETGGGSLAALGLAAAVLGGTAEVGNGIVDIAQGAGKVDAGTAEEAKQGINIANNPVAANALIVTNAKNAENIGNVATAALSARDVVKHSTGVAEGLNRILAAKDVKEGYQSAKELVREWGASAMQAYTNFALENF